MPYEYVDGIAVADVAFRARGKSLAEVFSAAVDATTGVMVDNLDAVSRRVRKSISLTDRSLDLLLFRFLQEVVYYKDAERLLLRAGPIRISETANGYALDAALEGEPIDARSHRLSVDVKAVTLHRLGVRKRGDGWEATVVLDV